MTNRGATISYAEVLTSGHDFLPPSVLYSVERRGQFSVDTKILRRYMFGAPEDDVSTLQRMHFEVTKLLDKENKGLTSYEHPIRKRHKMDYALTPPGGSKASAFRRFQVINKFISPAHCKDESASEKGVERVMGMIDQNRNDSFLTMLCNQVIVLSKPRLCHPYIEIQWQRQIPCD